MALTLAIRGTPSSTSIVAGQMVTLIAAVTNDGAASVTLNSLGASSSGRSTTIGQPDFLASGASAGGGQPALLPGATTFYPFRVVFHGPTTSGSSPQAPGGAGWNSAAYPINNSFEIRLTSVSSDGTVATVATQAEVLSTTLPFPLAQGGALQLNSGFNLVNFLTSFA